MDNKEVNQIDKTIEEIKEKQKFSLTEKKKTLEEIHLDEEAKLKQEDLEREQLLDKEINRINEMIKNSNPKWILDDFSEFICKKFDKRYNKEVIEVKIANKKNAMELLEILNRLWDDERKLNKYIKVVWDKDIYLNGYKKNLSEEKILQLIKGWVFYANTQIEYSNLKFAVTKSKTEKRIENAIAISIMIIVPVMVIALIIWILSLI